MINKILRYATEKIQQNSGVFIAKIDDVTVGENFYTFHNSKGNLIGQAILDYKENLGGFKYSMEVVDVCGEEYYTERGLFGEEDGVTKLDIVRTFHNFASHEDIDIEEVNVIFEDSGSKILTFEEKKQRPR